MTIKIIIGFCAISAIVLIIYFARAIMLTPVSVGENQNLEICITVCGASPELPQTVESLLWLVENGTIKAEICLVDGGMDEETRRASEILQRRGFLKIKS